MTDTTMLRTPEVGAIDGGSREAWSSSPGQQSAGGQPSTVTAPPTASSASALRWCSWNGLASHTAT